MQWPKDAVKKVCFMLIFLFKHNFELSISNFAIAAREATEVWMMENPLKSNFEM